MKWVENGEASVEFVCASDRPNVFLIGDSIRRGYCATTKEMLADRAEVFYVDDNCRSSQNIIFSMKKWANKFNDTELVDLVLFNCGQWDVARWNGHALPLTSESEYARNLQIIVDELRVFFPNARLIFATTSPMNPDGSNGVNPRTNADVDRYNELAVQVMRKNEIEIADVNGFMREWDSSYYTDSCHLTKDAFAMLGKYIADMIEPYIFAKGESSDDIQ